MSIKSDTPGVSGVRAELRRAGTPLAAAAPLADSGPEPLQRVDRVSQLRHRLRLLSIWIATIARAISRDAPAGSTALQAGRG